MQAHRADDGDKKARSPGRTRSKPLKPFAQGVPDRCGEPVVYLLVWFFHFHARLRVRTLHPAFPAPLIFEGHVPDKPRAPAPRECAAMS